MGQYNRHRNVTGPFDAVLLIAFGGPQSPADIRPFLENVLRGRRVAPGRVDEVVHHYEAVGGRSPITELTLAQAAGLRDRLAAAGEPLPVYVGMRNWHPFLADTLAEMSRAGVRRAIGVIAAAHRSYSSCTQYRENVADARAALARAGLADIEVTYVGDWFAHPLFVAANADRVQAALAALPEDRRSRAEVVFTAHSIPESMAARYPYQSQFEATSRLVMEQIARLEARPPTSYRTVYQSRSGRPEDPWLGPDICDTMRDLGDRRAAAAVVAPVGFLCDHVEVLYDLDVEAAAAARESQLPFVRALAVNDHARFLDMLADVVLQVSRRYAQTRPLELVAQP
jgi:protoporphyrin/coproporphyrin ferrochelatase